MGQRSVTLSYLSLEMVWESQEHATELKSCFYASKLEEYTNNVLSQPCRRHWHSSTRMRRDAAIASPGRGNWWPWRGGRTAHVRVTRIVQLPLAPDALSLALGRRAGLLPLGPASLLVGCGLLGSRLRQSVEQHFSGGGAVDIAELQAAISYAVAYWLAGCTSERSTCPRRKSRHRGVESRVWYQPVLNPFKSMKDSCEEQTSRLYVILTTKCCAALSLPSWDSDENQLTFNAFPSPSYVVSSAS